MQTTPNPLAAFSQIRPGSDRPAPRRARTAPKQAAVPLSEAEAELAERLDQIYATPAQRQLRPQDPAPYVGIASEPEDAIPVPPPLPYDARWSEASDPFADLGRDGPVADEMTTGGGRPPTAAGWFARPREAHPPAPWLDRKRKQRRGPRAGIASWLMTVLIVGAILAGAALAFFGYDRITAVADRLMGIVASFTTVGS